MIPSLLCRPFSSLVRTFTCSAASNDALLWRQINNQQYFPLHHRRPRIVLNSITQFPLKCTSLASFSTSNSDNDDSLDVFQVDDIRNKAETSPNDCDLLFECTKCTETFTSSLDLTRHLREVHWREIVMKRGKYEKKDFKFDKRFLPDSTVWKLKLTEEEADENSELSNEKQNKIGPIKNLKNTSKREHLCSECNKVFTSSSALKGHIRSVHRKERPYQCKECSWAFSRSDDLKKHIREVHRKERPHQCRECSRAFSRSGDLKQHLSAVHRKERPHQCPDCTKAFSRSSHLKQHLSAVHRKERPHQCPDCTKAFSEAGTLKKHIRAVHRKEKPLQSLECTVAFSQSTHFTQHCSP